MVATVLTPAPRRQRQAISEFNAVNLVYRAKDYIKQNKKQPNVWGGRGRRGYNIKNYIGA